MKITYINQSWFVYKDEVAIHSLAIVKLLLPLFCIQEKY
jgi:hypothetical protein